MKRFSLRALGLWVGAAALASAVASAQRVMRLLMVSEPALLMLPDTPLTVL